MTRVFIINLDILWLFVMKDKHEKNLSDSGVAVMKKVRQIHNNNNIDCYIVGLSDPYRESISIPIGTLTKAYLSRP